MSRREILAIPEIVGLDSRRQLVRIPPELDVPLTERVRRIIDTAAFRRLIRITQLGLVSLVYPAALHTRFEHSLGVYRLALLTTKRLAHDPRFATTISANEAELFILAALLHDVGHWPFCHPIEDLELPEIPPHEELAREFLEASPLAELLASDWDTSPREVLAVISGRAASPGKKLAASMLSGPVDVDKMDYLFRDSLHAGVPYGRHFDLERLIGSLCLNAAGDGLAITDKGKTAAELLVFARYVMFSEVYWHHAVRAATAMLQRAIYLLRQRLNLREVFRLTEAEVIAQLLRCSSGTPAEGLLNGLFGPTRALYKRVAQYSFFEHGEIYRRLAGRRYRWLVHCSATLAEIFARALGSFINEHTILIDAPPVKREVEFAVDVYFPKEDRYRPLGDVSPVVRTLAEKQFDDYVKRVRIFAEQKIAPRLATLPHLHDLIWKAIEETEASE